MSGDTTATGTPATRPSPGRPGRRLTLVGLAHLPLMVALGGQGPWALLTNFGLAVGLVLQRSRFCLASAIRDFALFGEREAARALVLLLEILTLGFAWLQLRRGAPLGSISPLGWTTALGGLFFGAGMVLSGNCIAGALWRLGEGHLAQVSTMAGLALGALAGYAWSRWGWLWPQKAYHLPSLLGWPLALTLQLLLLSAIWVWLKWTDDPTPPSEAVDVARGGGWPLFGLTTAVIWRKPWPVWFGAVAAGALSVGFLAWQGRPWRVTAPFLSWPTLLWGPDPAWQRVLGGFVLNLGLSLGAAFSALGLQEFRWRRPRSSREVVLAFGGGVLMGLGAALASGCTWGTMAAGIASLSLHGWIFTLFLFPGVWLGWGIVRGSLASLRRLGT